MSNESLQLTEARNVRPRQPGSSPAHPEPNCGVRQPSHSRTDQALTLLTEAKGRFAETIVSTLLEYAGYRVLRLGVEEMVSEVKAGVARKEFGLSLPDQLRAVPDFIVVDPFTGQSTLLEVKFRRAFDETVAAELHATLLQQLRYWPDTVTAVVCAAPPIIHDAVDVRAYVRCLRPNDLDRLVTPHAELSIWQRLRMLGGVFERFVHMPDLYRESEVLVGPIRAWA